MSEFHGVLLKFILLEFVLRFVVFPFGNLNSNNQDLIQYRLILSLNFITVDNNMVAIFLIVVGHDHYQ